MNLDRDVELNLVFAFADTKSQVCRFNKLDYLFGYRNGLPWDHIVEDMKSFKRNTTSDGRGSVVVMGVKTFETIPDLPDRYTMVIVSAYRDIPNIKNKNGNKPDFYITQEQLNACKDVLEVKSMIVDIVETQHTIGEIEKISVIGGAATLEYFHNRKFYDFAYMNIVGIDNDEWHDRYDDEDTTVTISNEMIDDIIRSGFCILLEHSICGYMSEYTLTQTIFERL